MHYTLRLSGDAPVDYPLDVAGQIRWHSGGAGWRAEIELPELPAEHIVVPSFAAISTPCNFQFTLGHDQDYVLQPVPAQAPYARAAASTRKGTAAASTHIDCWHTHTTLRGATVRLQVQASKPPPACLLTVSARPLIEDVPVPSGIHVQVQVPECISQMQAPRAVRDRICSPTALAMALSRRPRPPAWPRVIAGCYDPVTHAYGSWPLAIHLASRHGVLGAVEVLSDWCDVAATLGHGSPLVCSINFGQGELAGAPRAQTGGHLVVLYGIDGDMVLVHDPAGAEHRDVPRRYKLQEFSRAWLRHRGAAYIFCR